MTGLKTSSDFAGELDEELVEVEERHVAAGTAAEPDRGDF